MTRSLWMAVVGLLVGCAHVSPQTAPDGLGGTSWRVVKFQGGDGTVLVPFDCNRGRGTWTSPGPNQLQFGPLALTRMACPPAPIYDRIVQQWPFVRSYVVERDHLFVSLMADGGIFEFEPSMASR